jgi:hypothetical protein
MFPSGSGSDRLSTGRDQPEKVRFFFTKFLKCSLFLEITEDLFDKSKYVPHRTKLEGSGEGKIAVLNRNFRIIGDSKS